MVISVTLTEIYPMVRLTAYIEVRLLFVVFFLQEHKIKNVNSFEISEIKSSDDEGKHTH